MSFGVRLDSGGWGDQGGSLLYDERVKAVRCGERR